MYRATHCARNGPLPLLPSGPGGVGGITSRRTRHTNKFIIFRRSHAITIRCPPPEI